MYELLTRYEPEFLTTDEYKRYAAFAKKTAGGGKALDVGCGTGALTRALYAAGFDVKGLDLDAGSLSLAAAAASAAAMRIPFVQGDAGKGLKGFSSLSLVTAATDVVNHLRQPEAFFRSVHASLKPGGTFIFDISTAYKLRNILAGQVFTRFEAQFVRVWNNTNIRDKNRIEMELTYFVREADGRYTREDACGTQYIHETDAIADCLRSCGFSVSAFADFNGKPLLPDTQRCFFIAVKLGE